MPAKASTWWTDDRIDRTLNRDYVLAQLQADERELLKQSLCFGDGLTDDTYIDWILTRARRLFLILVHIGLPDQIFGLVDESYDDQDLPISLNAVQGLRLAQVRDKSLERRFYKTQFEYLVQDIKEGDHVRYNAQERIPVEPDASKAGIVPVSKDGVRAVRLASDRSKVYAQRRVVLDQAPSYHAEADVLAEIASLKRLKNQHLVSVFGSYLDKDSIYVLFNPASEFNLKSFIGDTPKQFDALPKSHRREIVICWPHCLASGLAWLHARGKHHGAIWPTNVHIDDKYRIFLGEMDAYNIVGPSPKVGDIEAYQYAAPERWKRGAAMQTTAPAKLALHSGGRTAHRATESLATLHSPTTSQSPATNRSSWTSDTVPGLSRVDTANPTSTTYPFVPSTKAMSSRSAGVHPRRRTGRYAASTVSSQSSGSRSPPSHAISHPSIPTKNTRPWRSTMTPTQAPSTVSSHQSSDNTRSVLPDPTAVAAPEVRMAVVQTWQSAQYDPQPADIFALAAIVTDILTFLCKRTAGAFSRFRSAKNRTAGRGGGLADASFHANISQVIHWMTRLQQDARKKARKDEGKALGAVSPVLEVVKLCLVKDPDDRLRAEELEKRLGDCIWRNANIQKLHCQIGSAAADLKEEPRAVAPQGKSPSSKQLATARPAEDEQQSRSVGVLDRDDSYIGLRAHGLTTTSIPSPGADSSLSSLSAFNFNHDSTSSGHGQGSESEEGLQMWNSRDLLPCPSSHAFEPEHDWGKNGSGKSGSSRYASYHDQDSNVDAGSTPSASSVESPSSTDSPDAGHLSGNGNPNEQKSFLFPPSRHMSLSSTRDEGGVIPDPL